MNDPISNDPPAPGFNPARAESIRAEALAAFDSKQRKLLRISGTYLLVLLTIAWFCLRLFNRSTDVQSWVLYGILFLVMFESTVLMKLWFWVLNSKLDVQREIRTLRMDLAVQKGSDVAILEAGKVATGTPAAFRGWEAKAWQLALALLGVLLAFEIIAHGPAAGGWLSFRKEILSVGGPVESGQSEFRFEAKGKALIMDLRADTQTGVVRFTVVDPDGKELGWHQGGGMTINDWKVDTTRSGAYALRVSSQNATGKWHAHIEEVEPNRFQGFQR